MDFIKGDIELNHRVRRVINRNRAVVLSTVRERRDSHRRGISELTFVEADVPPICAFHPTKQI
jgi:hypothetical protein